LLDDFESVAGKLFWAQFVSVWIVQEVLALDKTVLPHPSKKRVISRQAPRSWKEDAESIDSTRLLRPRGALPSDTETNKDDEVAPSHGLPQRLSTEHFQSITLAQGNRQCPRHLPMLQWVLVV
jgi:hypothetical protein